MTAFTNKIWPTAVVSIAIWGTAPALAQIEEIIVTAQKRSERVQDVPIAISAFSGDGLEKAGVNNADTLSQVVPGLQFGRQVGSSVPYLRGVGTQQAAGGEEGSIATYVDGVYRLSPYSVIQSFNNIERIEVLKGPQGTLFGRNATGGLVHIITKTPQAETAGNLSISYGSYDTFAAGFYGTTAVVDNLYTDLAITFSDQGKGYGKNRFTGNDANKSEEFGIRNKWRWDTSDNTDVTLAVDYTDMESSISIARQPAPGSLGVDGQVVFAGCIAGLGGNPGSPSPSEAGICAPVAAANATVNTGDFYDINSDTDPYYEAEDYGIQLEIRHSLDTLDVISISSYRENKASQILDQEGSILPVIYAPLQNRADSLQQEFRLESSNQEGLRWIAGLYYLDSQTSYDTFNLSGFGVAGLVPNAIAYQADPAQETTSYAAFLQLDYQLTSKTNVTAGFRLSHDKREYSASHQIVLGGPAGPFFTSLSDFHSAEYVPIPITADGAMVLSDQKSWTEPTWRTSINHQFTRDLMLYASYNRGFKSGLYNLPNPSNPGPVDPEFLDAYEIGFKSMWFEHRLQINGAAFYYDYKDLQLNSAAVGSTLTLNAGEAEIHGAEFDIIALPIDNLELRLGVSYLHTEYTSFDNAPFFTPTGFGGNFVYSGDAKGNKLNRSPEFTGNLSATYEAATELGLVTVFGNIYYNDGFYWEPQNNTEQKSYTLLNAGISLTLPGDNITFTLKGVNLSNEKYSYYDDVATFGSAVSSAEPRTYHAKIEYAF
ncbi:MAG: TonB-dependent receptor [Porticoccaceae bacterium]